MDEITALDRAAGFLPHTLSSPILFLPEEIKKRTEEIRLRCGQCMTLTLNDGCYVLPHQVTLSDIEETIQRMTRFSYHSVQESLRYGYFTAPGGYRIGVCGTVVMEHGVIKGIRSFSSLCIRIPRPVSCVSDTMLQCLKDKNVLICSAPGSGKTTFLRDLIRRLSEDGQRIVMVDERGELAALQDGVPQFCVGNHTD